MSVRELKRIEVLGRVKAGSLKVKDAAVLLGVCERQAKRLWRKYRRQGPAALRHKSAGRRSNRAKPPAWRRKVVRLYRRKYAGNAAAGEAPFGPTLAAEHMGDDDHTPVNPETLRRLLLAEGLWTRTRKGVAHRLYPNPNARRTVWSVLGDHPRIRLTEPLDYGRFVMAMKRAYLVLTDSGGVQEEAPALARPVLVMRVETERPEALREGVVKLVVTDFTIITAEAQRLLDDAQAYAAMARGISPYGDGKAAGRIAAVLRESAGRGEPPTARASAVPSR